MTNTPIQIGLIGCGGHGRYLAGQLAELERGILTSVYDAGAEAAASAAVDLSATAVNNVDDLLAQPELAGVIIAAPQFTHKDMTLKAAAAGKHIFCEKPLALNVADCDEMLAAAESAGIKLMAGQVLRLMAPFRNTSELIESEKLGDPSGVIIARCGGREVGNAWDGVAWRCSSELCGGLLFEVNVHELDFMRAICGEPESVFAHGLTVIEDNLAYDDLWFINVKFKNGAVGMLHASLSCYVSQNHITVQCPGGTISNNNDAKNLVLTRTDRSTTKTLTTDEQDCYENGFRHELRSWIDSIIDDSPMIVTGFDGRQAVAMAEAAIRSARSGQVETVA